jgi:hypothetical protein
MQQLRVWGSVWIAFALTTIITASAFAGPDDVHAVIPGTFGVLTKCRSWVVTTICRTYHHMRLPHRIAVGDTITLHFGSNPKHYWFPVARIDQKAGRCVIFSKAEATGIELIKSMSLIAVERFDQDRVRIGEVKWPNPRSG